MRKWKGILLILLTLLLVGVGGFLPTAVSYIQEKHLTNVVQYENIEALQLRLEEDVLSMTYLEKMFLLMHGAGVEITDENTRITEKQIEEATHAALMPYLDVFFGGSFGHDYMEYYPAMLYNESDPSRYACYWHVILSLDMSMSDSVSVILDDETGKILAVELIDAELYIEPAYLQDLQYSLAAVYFKELELEPVGEWPLEVESTDKDKNTEVSLAATNYEFVDPVSAEMINIQIGVRSDGFYIYLV